MRSKAADLRWGHFKHQPMRPYYRVTVDEPVDFEVVKAIVDALHPNNSNFGVDDVVGHLNHNPTLAARNLATVRNEGFLKSLDKDVAFLQQQPSGSDIYGWSEAVDPWRQYVAFQAGRDVSA